MPASTCQEPIIKSSFDQVEVKVLYIDEPDWQDVINRTSEDHVATPILSTSRRKERQRAVLETVRMLSEIYGVILR